MVTSRISVTGVAIIVALTCAAPFAWADREGDRGERRGQQDVQEPRGETPREGPRAVQPRETHKAPARSAETPRQRKVSSGEGHPAPAPGPQPVLPREARRPGPPPHPGYVLDKRYGHNHYYPPRGYAVPVLPRDYRVVHYHGSPYYYHSGIWYRPYGSRFVVVVPPFGIVVPILPPFYTTIWWGGIPYYYAGGVYYTWYPDYLSKRRWYPMNSISIRRRARARNSRRSTVMNATAGHRARPASILPSRAAAYRRRRTLPSDLTTGAP